MQYTLATLLALGRIAMAQTEGFDAIVSPPEGTTMQAGEPFVITWEPAPSTFDDEEIDILLLAGETPSTLNVVEPAIAEGLTNSDGSFEWLVPADLGDDETYGIKIVLKSDPETFQFSFPFAIDAAEGGGNSTSGSDSTTTAKPTSTSSVDDEDNSSEADSTSASYPETTLYTTPTGGNTGGNDIPDAGVPTQTSSTIASPGAAGAQATAGAFAVIGGLAVAALAL